MKLEAAMEIGSSQEREKALAEIAWNAMETEPEIAHQSFAKLSTDSPEKLRLIRHYAMRLAERNPKEAVEWAASLESESEISAAMSHVAVEISETDPIRAADLLSEFGLSGRDFDVAVVQVIQRWAARSPSEAAAWISAFQPGTAREAGLGVIAGKWLPMDPSAAFAWFDSLRDEKLRQETARAMEGILLQQPDATRSEWTSPANPGILAELEAQRKAAMLDVGDNIQSALPRRTP